MLERVRVKICGITSPEDGVMAAQAGADAIGLVFWPRSPRFVETRQAREIVARVPPFVTRVGVFVNAPAEEVERVAQEVGLDVLQLHGDEPPESVARSTRRVVKALRVGADLDADRVAAYARLAAGILLDHGTRDTPGGTGLTFDWSLARRARASVPWLIVAGGLTPENVRQAIEQTQPDAVDVSSGVESAPGKKDQDKVRAFVAAVRAAAG